MTIRDFCERTKARLHADGAHISLSIKQNDKDKEEYVQFCKENKEEIASYLRKRQNRVKEKAALEATLNRILILDDAWELYRTKINKFIDSGGAEEEPERPSITKNEFLATISEKELSYYKASIYANSYDVDKSKLGEDAKNEIADSEKNFETILYRMKQAWKAIVESRTKFAFESELESKKIRLTKDTTMEKQAEIKQVG